jgi:hypothetical protein
VTNAGKEVHVLGVDLASTRWSNVGTALVSYSADATAATAVEINPVAWPTHEEVTSTALTETLDIFLRAREVAAVSIDGPQGWRDPDAPISQGMGRACEKSARTPGKTGTPGITWPRKQVGWITFSIRVFDELLGRPHARLINDLKCRRLEPPRGGYWVLECFPTATWRSSGLLPLPAKGKRPSVVAFSNLLRVCWKLPESATTSDHDGLQAIVASLPAATLLGAGEPIAHGRPATVLPNQNVRVEGIIWDAHPLESARSPSNRLLRSSSRSPRA